MFCVVGVIQNNNTGCHGDLLTKEELQVAINASNLDADADYQSE